MNGFCKADGSGAALRVRLVGPDRCNLRPRARMRQLGGTHAAGGELFRWSIRKIWDYNDDEGPRDDGPEGEAAA